MYVPYFIYPSLSWWGIWVALTLGLFFFLMNNLALNIWVFVWIYIFISLGWIPRSRTVGSHSCFNILRNCQTVFSKVTVLFTFLQQHMQVSFSTASSTPVLVCILIIGFGCELGSHDEWCWAPFHVLICYLYVKWASLVTQLVKNPPIMQETLVRFLGWEDALEKGWATHSSILGLPLWLSW